MGVATGMRAVENKMVWRKECRVGGEGQGYMARLSPWSRGQVGSSLEESESEREARVKSRQF